jgi:replicative DNA helicase
MSDVRIRSTKLEQRLLICCLETRDPKIRRKILSETTPDDFVVEEARNIRRHMEKLLRAGKPLGRAEDMAEDAAMAKHKEAAFILALPEVRLACRQYSAERVDALLHKLQVYVRRMALLKGVQQISAMAQDKASDEILAQAVTLLEKTARLTRPRQEQKPPTPYGAGMDTDDVKKIIRRVTTPDERDFIPTGLPALDDHITGFRRGDMVVLSARRGGFKTALALQMAYNVFRAKCNVAFCSMEMPWNQLEERLLSNLSGTPYSVIRTQTKSLGQEERKQLRRRLFRQMERDMHQFGQEHGCHFLPLDQHDGTYTPMRLRNDLVGQQIDIVFIDYLTQFNYSEFNYDLVKGQMEYSRYLKLLAEQLHCVVVVLTQLNEDDHVKYSRGPEEATDWWLWWRYGEDERNTGVGEIRLDKARGGVPCTFPCTFQPSVMRLVLGPAQRGSKEKEAAKKTSEWNAGSI